MTSTVPLQFGIPGGPELLIILLIAVLLFGANKIPKLARSTGEALGEFQKGREEVEQELEEMRGSPSASDESSSADEPDVERVEEADEEGATSEDDASEETTDDETGSTKETTDDETDSAVEVADAETDDASN